MDRNSRREDYYNQNEYFRPEMDETEQLPVRRVLLRDIYITLGSPWIPEHMIEEFIDYIRGRQYLSALLVVKHDEITGAWEILPKYPGQSYKKYSSYECEQRFGTSRWRAPELLLRTLNLQSVAVYDTIESAHTKTGKQRVLNKDETILALDKQKLLIETFRRWILNDAERARELKGIYEEAFLRFRD